MTVKRLFLMRQQNTSYQQKGSKFLYLNKYQPLQLTTTRVMIDSIMNELHIPFLVSFYIIRCFLDILMNFIFKDCFCVYHFLNIYFLKIQLKSLIKLSSYSFIYFSWEDFLLLTFTFPFLKSDTICFCWVINSLLGTSFMSFSNVLWPL